MNADKLVVMLLALTVAWFLELMGFGPLDRTARSGGVGSFDLPDFLMFTLVALGLLTMMVALASSYAR